MLEKPDPVTTTSAVVVVVSSTELLGDWAIVSIFALFGAAMYASSEKAEGKIVTFWTILRAWCSSMVFTLMVAFWLKPKFDAQGIPFTVALAAISASLAFSSDKLTWVKDRVFDIAKNAFSGSRG